MRAFRLLTTAASFALTLIVAAPAGAGPADLDPAVDPSVRPGDDFYRFANNPWLKATALPDGQTSYGTSSMLVAENARRVRALIDAAAQAPNSALAQKIGDYYSSLLDTQTIEARGLTPLTADLAAIAAIADRHALAVRLGQTLTLDDGSDSHVDSLFGIWVHQGFHDPDHYVPHVVQGGLGMESGGLYDRDVYLDPAPNSPDAAARDAYRAHIATVLKAAGFSDAETRAARVLALEIAIAQVHASAADTGDVFKTDTVWSPGDFAAKAPGLDWPAFFQAAGLDRQSIFVVWQPGAVTSSAALIASQPLDTWKDYLAFHLIAHYAQVLPSAIAPPVADRAQWAVAATTDALGEGIGRLYVERWFPPSSKAAADDMVANIRTVFRAHIAAATWMSPATRAEALAKLETLKVGMGYPDVWTDYSALVVVRGDAFGNWRRAEAFAWRQSLAKLTRPVDPAEWALPPQTVGAILNLSPNSMQFAAGIEQPPYFDSSGDLAVNYGSAGAGLAHEVSHTFDEVGNIYDAHGNLVRWWTAEDGARYDALTAPLAKQLDADCPAPDLCVHSHQVLGESAADLIGLQVAYEAYHLALHGRPDTVIGGLSGDQRFFLAFARRWRRIQTTDALRRQIATDIHLPPEYRADAVRNIDAWYDAFAIKPGDRLYLKPEDRVKLW